MKGRGPERIHLLPDAARPNCEECPKPEIGPINSQTIRLYELVREQQMISDYSGIRRGMRFEAVVQAVEWGHRRGWITDPDEVMERVWILDSIANRIANAKAEAAAKAKSSS